MELGQRMLGGVLEALGQQVAAQEVFAREARLPGGEDVAGELALHGLGIGPFDCDR